MACIELEDVRLHYQIDGKNDRPFLVFSNAVGTNLHLWDSVLAPMAAHYRIVRYDTRGHGGSSAPVGDYTLDLLGRDVLSLLDALKIERCHFCGVSIGGMIGMWLGIHAPERIAMLILSNTAARIGTIDRWNNRIGRVRNLGIDAMADETLARWLTVSLREEHSDLKRELRAALIACSADGYAGCCAVLRDTDLTSELHLIRAPALVVAGTFDPAVPTSQSRILHDRIRCAKYLELPTAHLSPVEQPQKFADATLDFLASLEQEHHG